MEEPRRRALKMGRPALAIGCASLLLHVVRAVVLGGSSLCMPYTVTSPIPLTCDETFRYA